MLAPQPPHPSLRTTCPEAEPQHCTPDVRQLEVQDDDVEDIIATAAVGGGEDAADSGVDELECTVVWDSSDRLKQRRRAVGGVGDDAPDDRGPPRESGPADAGALHLKLQGNQLFRRGDDAGALQCYLQALDLAAGSGTTRVTSKEAEALPQATRRLLAELHSNLSAVALRQGRHGAAVAAARRACALAPGWLKAVHRLAEAQLKAGNYAAAVAACRAGEARCVADSQGHTEFTPLLDTVAVAAAAAGSLAGYDGRQLEVRCAGADAWLGRPAPHVPEVDGPLDEESALPSDDLSAAAAAPATPALTAAPHPSAAAAPPSKWQEAAGGHAPAAARALALGRGAAEGTAGGGDALASWDYRDARALARRQRTSFRSVREALAAARDGDRVLLRRGVHNGMGESVAVDRRVLIQGEGALGETVIDQRANCPMFRVTRGGAAILNIDLDQTGFREAVLVTGGTAVAPLLDGCILKCSGDDAINVGGSSAPLLRRCTITAKKCGVRAYGAARPRLEGCVLENCGEQGVKAMESSAVTLSGCKVTGCGEEGAVAMASASVALSGCHVSGNKGPGVDASGGSHVSISGGRVEGNVGGVWLWEQSTAQLERAFVDGGPSQVILADGGGAPSAVGCTIKGSVHATDAAWQGLLDRGNTFEDPDVATDFPPEEGPFRFVPNRFTRKQ